MGAHVATSQAVPFITPQYLKRQGVLSIHRIGSRHISTSREDWTAVKHDRGSKRQVAGGMNSRQSEPRTRQATHAESRRLASGLEVAISSEGCLIYAAGSRCPGVEGRP